MMEHLGGPESAEKIAERQARYEKPDSCQFVVVDAETGEGVGWVGYWEREWLGRDVYEMGWAILPAAQGHGLATAATVLALGVVRAEPGGRRFVHAYPSVDNAASNAICRKAGFELLGPFDYEYPPGHPMRNNDWRFDLNAAADAA